MAEVVRYVNTGSTTGGNGTTNATTGANRAYASLSEWESSEQTDLVTDADTHVVYCEGATDDTTAVTLAGWTTGASNGITIDGQHDSIVLNESNYILKPTNATRALSIDVQYVTVKNIQVVCTCNDGGLYHDGIRPTVDNVHLEDCIVKGVISATSTRFNNYFFSNITGTTRTAKNCLAYDGVNGTETCRGFYCTDNTDNAVDWVNCGAFNCRTGYGTGYRDAGVTNCWAVDCVDGFGGTFSTDSDYNASDIASDAPGSNSQNGTSPTFSDEATDDFNLASGDTVCRGNGVGPSTDSNVPTTDINGNTRSGTTCDIGPAEYVAGGTSISATTVSRVRTVYTATVQADVDVNISATNVSRIRTFYAATVTLGKAISATSVSRVRSVYAAVVQANVDTDIVATTVSRVRSTYAASVVLGTAIAATTVSRIRTVYNAAVKANTSIAATTVARTRTMYTATVTLGLNISATTVSRIRTTYNAVISASVPTNIVSTTISRIRSVYAATIAIVTVGYDKVCKDNSSWSESTKDSDGFTEVSTNSAERTVRDNC